MRFGQDGIRWNLTAVQPWIRAGFLGQRSTQGVAASCGKIDRFYPFTAIAHRKEPRRRLLMFADRRGLRIAPRMQYVEPALPVRIIKDAYHGIPPTGALMAIRRISRDRGRKLIHANHARWRRVFAGFQRDLTIQTQR